MPPAKAQPPPRKSRQGKSGRVQSGSGVPPLGKAMNQRRDAAATASAANAATLGDASQNSPAPKGRNKLAQGNALGNMSKNIASPEGATQNAWPVVPLGQIAEVKLGKMLDKAKHQTGRRFPYLRNINVRWGMIDTDNVFEMNFEDDQLERFGLCGGDVLVCEGGEPGRAALWNGQVPEMKFQKAIHRVRFNVPFEPKLLVYLLESLAKSGRLERRFTGSTIKHFTREAFVQLPVPLPPLPDQRRIVAEIEKQFTRLDAGVAALKRVQANLKRYRAAVLKAACEGKLVPTEAELQKSGGSLPEVALAKAGGQKSKAKFETGADLLARILEERRQKWQGRGKYKEPADLDTAGLPQLPKGWTWATLDQIGQEARPIIYGIIKPGPHIPDGVPYVRVTEMKDGRIDVPNLKRASHERAAKFARATLAPGDVLISKDGTIGRVAVVPPELAGGNITQHVMRAPIHAIMLRDFVVWAVRSDWCQHWLTGETRGVALRGVNVEDFRRLPIPIPPLAEQTRIVAEVERRLSVVEELESVVNANIQRTTRLRQSILQKAFTGRI